MDRDAFLDRIRGARATAELPEPLSVPARLGPLPDTDRVALFTERATSVNAVVHGPMPPGAVPSSVAEMAAAHSGGTFMAWDELPVSGVVSALGSAGMDRIDHRVPTDNRLGHQEQYARLRLGVTGALCGLAESGSVVLSHGPGRPRMASLIPDQHVALLSVGAMERSLAHWAHRHPEALAGTANLVVITGPSRTGDIELQLNLGVHGPRTLHIVLVSR